MIREELINIKATPNAKGSFQNFFVDQTLMEKNSETPATNDSIILIDKKILI